MYDFSIKLQLLLKELNLNQNEFAKKIKVSSPTVSLWVQGKRSIKLDNLQKIVKVFNLPKDYFDGPVSDDKFVIKVTEEEYILIETIRRLNKNGLNKVKDYLNDISKIY